MTDIKVPEKAAAHTPGPWRLDGNGVSGRAFDGSWCWIVDRVRGGTPTQMDANLYLIAGAPALLAAAVAMVAALDETKYDVFIGSPADLQRLVESRRGLIDAIANAEGAQ